MLREESEVVPEGNGPVQQEEEFGSGQPPPVHHFQRLEEIWDWRIDVITRLLEQHLASQKHDARQPRLAMEADRPANTKTRERTGGTTNVVQAMFGDSCTAQKGQDGAKTSISFSVKAEPPDLPYREDVLVDDSAAAPKSWLPSLEMLATTVAHGLVLTGKTSTETETIFNEPLIRFYATEETSSKKKIL